MKKIFKQILILAALIFILILPYLVFASSPAEDLLKRVATGEGGSYQDVSETTISEILGTAVNAFLGLLGVIFIALIIYAGYYWMTAQGDDEKVKKAKDTIRQAIIGLVLVIAAFAIWTFIYFRIIMK